MSEASYIGTSVPRREGAHKLTGQAQYVSDVRRHDWLHARLVLSPYAHAKIEKVDLTPALRLAGVVAAFSAQDLTLARLGHQPPGAPDRMLDVLLAHREVFFAGEPVAVVLAETAAAAEDGAEAVEVSYQRLPAATDARLAMAQDAPRVRTEEELHGGEDEEAAHGAAVGGETSGKHAPNVTRQIAFDRGDIEQGWRLADQVVEGSYKIAGVHQAYLEPQAAAAEAHPDGSVTIWASTQGAFYSRSYAAQCLGLSEDQVRIVPMTVGGAFGGKGGLLEPLAAALATVVRRPVMLVLDRLQDFLVSNPGPAAEITVRLGASRDGKLTGIFADLLFDSGAAAGSPVGIAGMLLGGTYQAPHLAIRGVEVVTHKVPVGAYRAPGAPQAYFALESAMDELARTLDMDPLTLRRKNASVEGDPQVNGRPWARIGLAECLERAAQDPLWRKRQKGADEGIGVAAGGWPGGTEPAAAVCKVNGDGSLTVQVGSVDITGTHTTFALIAAQAFGIDPSRIRVVAGDTDQAPYAGFAGGSKITSTVGAAVLLAAEDAKRQILELAATEMEAAAEDLELADGQVRVKGVPEGGKSVAELAALTTGFGAEQAPVTGQGRTAITKSAPGFAVHIAKVRLDRRHGWLKIVDYLAVQDVGKALNPAAVAGQMRGGSAQGIGRALFEQMVYQGGQLQDASFADYDLPLASDLPPIRVEMVEVPSPVGPFGAKGVGEPPAIPGAATVANAIRDAGGPRLTSLPIRPDQLIGD
ncbi:MAG: xanthine dehydrogenase family protein molybdopterin-binding subunit [Sulfobacillus sp.]